MYPQVPQEPLDMSSMRLFLTQTIKMSLITRQAPTLPVPSHTPRSHLPKIAATHHPQARCPLAPFLPTEHILSLTCPYQLSAPLHTPHSKNHHEHTSRSYPSGPFHQGCPLARFHPSHTLPQGSRAEGRLLGGPTVAAAPCPGRGLAPTTVTPEIASHVQHSPFLFSCPETLRLGPDTPFPREKRGHATPDMTHRHGSKGGTCTLGAWRSRANATVILVSSYTLYFNHQ